MVELEQRIEELKKIKDPGEDLEVCQEELSGLEDLVLEDAQNLHRRVVAVRKIYYKYEDAKRKLSGGNLRLVVSSPRNTATAACRSWTSSRKATPA
jgi:RNA polymerase primary sigma factor